MFTALRSATLKALAACAILSGTTGVARADLTQYENVLPARNARGEEIVDCDLKLTVQYDPSYEPADGFKPLVFVHGGGWTNKTLDGSPLWNLVATEFTRRGFIVYLPEYRLIKAPGAKPKASQAGCGHVGREDQHRDVRQGFEASLGMADESPWVDIERGITLVGHSAGAHLVTFAALNMPDHLRTRIRGVIPLSGPISFRNYWNQAHGLEPSALRPRHVRLGDYDVTLGAVDAKSREAIYGVLDTYVSEGAGLKKLVDLTAEDTLLDASTFASVYKPNDRVRPPFYFVHGADDDVAYPEGTIQACQAIGLISNVKRIRRSFLFWTQQHYVGRCGGGADRIHVIAPADHAFNFNQSFWQDALGWSDALEPR